jgi:hypothetical protein
VAKNDLTAEGNGAVDVDPDLQADPAVARAKAADLEAIDPAHGAPEVQTAPEVAIDRIFDETIHANANAARHRLRFPISIYSSFRTTKASSLWRVRSR